MELIRLIRAEVDKNIRSIGFLACALLVTVLCFTTNAYTSTSIAGVTQSYTVIELFLNFNTQSLCRLGVLAGSAQFLVERLYKSLFFPCAKEDAFSSLGCCQYCHNSFNHFV